MYDFHSHNSIFILPGAQVRSVFQQSGLSKDQLAFMWTQVDRDKDGYINKQEFCEAMNYIRRHQGSGSQVCNIINGCGQ